MYLQALLDAVDASNKGKVPNKRYVEGSGGCSGQGSDEGSADESMRDTAEHVDRFEVGQVDAFLPRVRGI